MSNKLRRVPVQSRSTDRLTPQPTASSLISQSDGIPPHVFSLTSPAYRMADSTSSLSSSISAFNNAATTATTVFPADTDMNDTRSPSPRNPKRVASAVYEHDVELPSFVQTPLSSSSSGSAHLHPREANGMSSSSSGRSTPYTAPAPRAAYTRISTPASAASSTSSSAASSATTTPTDVCDSSSETTASSQMRTIEHKMRDMLFSSMDGPLRSGSISPLPAFPDYSITRLMFANVSKARPFIDGSPDAATIAAASYENARCDSMIIGLTPLKQWARLNILMPLFCKNHEIREQMRRSPPQRARMIFSKCGSGVASYVAALCQEFCLNLIVLRSDGFDVKRLPHVFDEACKNQPCVVFFDHTYSWFSPGLWMSNGQHYFAAVRDLAESNRLTNMHTNVLQTVSSGSPFTYPENVWSIVSLTGPLCDFPVDNNAMDFMFMHITYLESLNDQELVSFLVFYYKKLWGAGAEEEQHMKTIVTQAKAAAVEFKDQTPGFITMIINHCMSKSLSAMASGANASDILHSSVSRLPLLSDIRTILGPMRERASVVVAQPKK